MVERIYRNDFSLKEIYYKDGIKKSAGYTANIFTPFYLPFIAALRNKLKIMTPKAPIGFSHRNPNSNFASGILVRIKTDKTSNSASKAAIKTAFPFFIFLKKKAGNFC